MDEDFFGFEKDKTPEYAREFEESVRQGEEMYMDVFRIDELFLYYVEENELAKAQVLLDHAFLHHPYNDELFMKQAGLYFEEEKYEKALTFIDKALTLQPTLREYRQFRAEILAHLSQYEQAIDELELVLDSHPDPHLVYAQMGHIALLCNQRTDAETYLKQAQVLAPTSEEVVFELAYFYESGLEIDTAIQLYQDFLDEVPFSQNAWYNLGLLQCKIEKYEDGIESFDFALAIQDDFTSAYFHKGRALMLQEKYQEALQVFLEVINLDAEDMHNQYHIAECYEALSSWQMALKYYLQVSDKEPEHIDSLLGIAYCLEQMDRYTEAIHYYQKAEKIDDPGNTDIMLSIAMCEYKLGNLGASYLQLQQAIDINPNSISLWEEWSDLLVAHLNIEGAITFLEEGIKHNPLTASLYYRCAGFYFALDKMGKTLVMLENALLLDSSGSDGFLTMFPLVEGQASIMQLIRQYKKKG